VRRVPWLTLSVTLVTAVVNACQAWVPGLLQRLERTPAVLHGEPWRVLTSLLVQDGGVLGAASNLCGLAVLGLAAERAVPRPHWLVGYLGAGLAGELAGLGWQPVGGGNSVAVCGLAGLVTLACLRRNPLLPSWAGLPALVWSALMLAVAVPSLYLPAVAVAGFVGATGRQRPYVRYAVPAGAVAAAAVLLAGRDLHGAALGTGLLLGTVLVPRGLSSVAG
jgi:membrane associated rhomboid family serine protease